MHKLLLICLLLATGLTLRAQSGKAPAPGRAQVETALRSMNVLPPSYTYEAGLGRLSTLKATAGLGIPLSFYSFGFHIALVPKASVYYRYYYNLDQRHAQGKNTRYNSANYMAVGTDVSAPAVMGSARFDGSRKSVELHWGRQRMHNRTKYDLSAGIRVLHRTGSDKIKTGPSLKFTISRRLEKD